MDSAILKVFIPFTISFLMGLLITPWVTHYLYKHKMWKTSAKTTGIDGREAPVFNSLHKYKEVGTPRMGGIVIWGAVALTTIIFWTLPQIVDTGSITRLSFLSRGQTWLPLASLILGAIIGLADDLLQIKNAGGAHGGLSLSKRIIGVLLIGLIGAMWFYFKLGMTAMWIPFVGLINIGWLTIPLFILVMLAMFSGGIIDGLDGLSGGIFTIMYSSYALIAFYQMQYDIAAFSAVVAGATLAFLWFNIPPARFYMTETGSLGLTITLSVIAFLTDTVFILLFIGFPLLAEAGSDIIQILSKKFRGKKVFHIAPIHHHFEAIGWPAYKVTMRFWIIGILTSVIGIVVAIAGK